MKRSSFRSQRVAELIHQSLAELIQREVKDPRVKGVAITRVALSPDMSVAKIYCSHLYSEHSQGDILTGLEKCKGFLRVHLKQSLHLRIIPHLVFIYDDGPERGQKIEDALKSVIPPKSEYDAL